MTSITSEEVNYLIYRYLQEAGFVHSAFTFGQESFITSTIVASSGLGASGGGPSPGSGGTASAAVAAAYRSLEARAGSVPPGMLITLLQKGLHYAAIEFHLDDDGNEKSCNRPFTLLEPHTCDGDRNEKERHKERKTSFNNETTLPKEGSSGTRLLDNNDERAAFNHKPVSNQELDNHNQSTFVNSKNGKKRKSESKEGGFNGTRQNDEPRGVVEGVDESVTEDLPIMDRKRPSGKEFSTGQGSKKLVKGGKSAKTGSSSNDVEKKSSNTTSLTSHDKKKNKLPSSMSLITDKIIGNAGSSLTKNSKPKSKSTLTFNPHQIHILQGHQSEVITCAWNPQTLIDDKSQSLVLASASGDGTTRIWAIPQDWSYQGQSSLDRSASASSPLVVPLHILRHDGDVGQAQDVTTMDWSPSGEILATGCYDGRVRLWQRKDGQLIAVGSGHRGPIFQLRWSPNGQHLISAGLEPAIVVWKVSSPTTNGEESDNPTKLDLTALYSFANHTAPALDVDWRDDELFSTCSSDRQVHIYRLPLTHSTTPMHDSEEKVEEKKRDLSSINSPSTSSPSLVLTGHTDEVNSIRWSPSKHLLLSSSDDRTALIWRVTDDGTSGELLYSLAEHTQEIYTAKWQPSSSSEPTTDTLTVATASFDTTIKIWQIPKEKELNASSALSCSHTLRYHRQPVYAISFSPDGRYLASGSLDGYLAVWSVNDGNLIRTYEGIGGIFEVTWNGNGDRLAACTSERELIVLDFIGKEDNGDRHRKRDNSNDEAHDQGNFGTMVEESTTKK